MKTPDLIKETALASLLFFSLPSDASAVSPSITGDMPPEVQSLREVVLSRGNYEDLVDQWRSYSRRNPDVAVAYVQQSRAMRYAGMGTAEDRSELIGKAYELDPDCPEVLEVMASCCMGEINLVDDCAKASEYGEQAVLLAPGWPEPHFTLWGNALVLGRTDEAQGHLKAILEKDGIQPPILDFGYNLLVSANHGAIVFTNGDNDTYPPVALQQVRNVRPDVLIVNLSLLNKIEYAESVWSGRQGEAPFTEKEIRSLENHWKGEGKEGSRLSSEIVLSLVNKVKEGSWNKPVYFAVTVAGPVLESCDRALELEGLLWRVTGDPRGSDDELRMNAAKTLRLFRGEFRLESATDLAYDWRPEASATKLLRNYTALLRIAATEAAGEGDLEDVRFALGKAIAILDFHGDEETVSKLAEYWKKLDPNNTEMNRWIDEGE